MKVLVILLLLAMLSGCQNVISRDADSPFYRVPGGSTLVLHRAVTIPPNYVKAYFQDGRRVHAPNQYEPFCKLEVLPLKPAQQIVQADRFFIKNTSWVRDIVAMTDTRYFYAALGPIWLRGEDLPSPMFYSTHLYLHSETQPDVYRVVCGHLQDPATLPRHLSVNQIRTALGDFFTLSLPAG